MSFHGQGKPRPGQITETAPISLVQRSDLGANQKQTWPVFLFLSECTRGVRYLIFFPSCYCIVNFTVRNLHEILQTEQSQRPKPRSFSKTKPNWISIFFFFLWRFLIPKSTIKGEHLSCLFQAQGWSVWILCIQCFMQLWNRLIFELWFSGNFPSHPVFQESFQPPCYPLFHLQKSGSCKLKKRILRKRRGRRSILPTVIWVYPCVSKIVSSLPFFTYKNVVFVN